MNPQGGHDVKISELPAAQEIRQGDLIVVVQDGVTKRATVAQLLAAGGILVDPKAKP